MRGGLWEVDLAARRMACAYWPEPAHSVSRGTWFIEKGADWVPLKVGSAPPGGLCHGMAVARFHLAFCAGRVRAWAPCSDGAPHDVRHSWSQLICSTACW